jgi:hypothetical protein
MYLSRQIDEELMRKSYTLGISKANANVSRYDNEHKRCVSLSRAVCLKDRKCGRGRALSDI